MNKNKTTQNFAGIPRVVIEHPDFQSLSANAKALLIDLAYQYRGKNNGDLTTAETVLKKRGWKSRGTIHRAKKQLLAAELIIETRPGQFTNPGGRCALYALSWASIDECPGKHLESKPTVTPSRSFKLETNVVQLKRGQQQ